MKQGKIIGRLGLTAEGYDNFVSLPYKEQLEQVYNSLSPKDYVQAEKALKGVPNGDKPSTQDSNAKSSAATIEGGSAKDSNAKPGSDKGEGKGVSKGN